MKYIIALIILIVSHIAYGQTPDCVEGRYTTDLFQEISSTTVQYGKNINIGTTDSLDLFMDIYTPTNDTETSRPVMILAHGGSFVFGNRADVQAQCLQYARKGYVTASISYHLWPLTSGFPDSLELLDVVIKAVHDMKGAIRYFKNDQAFENLWNIDSTRIIIGGYSAGAILAMHTSHMDTTDIDLPDFIKETINVNGGIEGKSNKLSNTSDVIGTINLSGALYHRNLIDVDDPPFISFHGDNDDTVPFGRGFAAGIISMEGSSLLHERADEIGVRNRFDAVSGGGHIDIYTDNNYASARETFFEHADSFLGSLVCPSLISASKNLPFASTVSVHPNPAKDFITISFDQELAGVDISIYNLNGQLITFHPNLFGNTINIDVSSLHNGMYILELADPEGGTDVQKLIVR